MISVQREAHSSSCRLTRKLPTIISPSYFYHCILSNFCTKELLATSHINFSTSSTIDIAVKKYPNLCNLLQVPRNGLHATARRQAETCTSCCYRKQFLCLENGSGCNFQVAEIEQLTVCARCRIKQCSSSRWLNCSATKVCSVRGLCGRHFFPVIVQDEEYTFTVTLRCVRATIVVVGKQ